MKSSYILATLLAVAATAWVASGQLEDDQQSASLSKPPADLSKANHVAQVRVRSQEAVMRLAEVVLRGRSEALRNVEIKVETQGRVEEILVEAGQKVRAGDVLVRLAEDDRPAILAEAKALHVQRKLEYEAAKKLSAKGFRAETQLAGNLAQLQAAEAAVRRAEIEFANTVIKAPFDGLVDERDVEIGDFLDTGDAIARVVDLNPILVVAHINEQEVGQLVIGAEAEARFITGQTAKGRLRFIGSVADPLTRTFRVELELENPEGRIPDGVTAELVIPLAEQPAHLVSPAILTLTDDGVVGVKTLEAGDTVGFHPVVIKGTGPEGVWLGGLPQDVTLITVGQDFVTVGQSVKPVREESLLLGTERGSESAAPASESDSEQSAEEPGGAS